MKKLTLISLFSIAITTTFAQNDVQNNDREIFTEHGLYYRLSPSDGPAKKNTDSDTFDGINVLSACYTDAGGKVRRLINYETWPESAHYSSFVYDKTGQLERFYQGWADFESCSHGSAVKQYNPTDTQKTIKYDFLKGDYIPNDFDPATDFYSPVQTRHAGECAHFSELFHIADFSGYLTSEGGSKKFNTDDFLATQQKGKKRRVIFDRPKVGDFTFVIANRVNIRTAPNRKAEVIIQANVGYCVEVKEVITTSSGEVWYQVYFVDGYVQVHYEKIAYIHGDFLDDTAQAVED